MAISLVAVGAKITASFMNSIVALVNRQGYTRIIPTAVSGTGVTIASDGLVTAATSVTDFYITFATSDFNHYEVAIDFYDASADADLGMQVASGFTALTSGSYILARNDLSNTGTPSGSYSGTATFIPIGRVTSGQGSDVSFKLFNLRRTRRTRVIGHGMDDLLLRNFGGTALNATSYDTIRIGSSSGTTTFPHSVTIKAEVSIRGFN